MKQEKSKGYALHNEDGRMSDRLNNRLTLNLIALWLGIAIVTFMGVVWKAGLQDADIENSYLSAIVATMVAVVIIALAVLLSAVSRVLLECLVIRVVSAKLRLERAMAKQLSTKRLRSMILWRKFTKYVDDSEKEFLELYEMNIATLTVLPTSIVILSGFAAERLGFYLVEVLVIGAWSIMDVVVCIQDAMVLAFEEVRREE